MYISLKEFKVNKKELGILFYRGTNKMRPTLGAIFTKLGDFVSERATPETTWRKTERGEEGR